MKKYFINPEDFNEVNKENDFDDSADELELLSELDGVDDSDLFPTEIVEVMDTEENVYQFYYLEELQHNGKNYIFLQPAELIDGLNEDDVYIFTLDEKGEQLMLVENEELIDILFSLFNETYKGEYKGYDDEYLS